MDKKNQILMSVLGVFALVIVTVGVSYAFFTYSRTGTTTNSIKSGEISFTYKEGGNATLTNVFPVADSVGAADTTGAYTFDVSTTIVGDATMAYDVILVKDMTDSSKKYFEDNQIKLNLLKNGAAIQDSLGSTTTGVLASSFTWAQGEAKVLTNVPITSGTKDTYTLRLWIDEGVDYSNTSLTDDGTDANNDAQTSTGKYNGYEYSLKVKVEARATNTYTGTTS